MDKNKYQLILASQSPRRFELLSWLDIPFKAISPQIEEVSFQENPQDVAVDLATQKGNAVFKKENQIEKGLILSFDTIVVLDNEIIGKPSDRNEARQILKKLSGRTHDVFTGCYLLPFSRNEEGRLATYSFFSQTKVTFDKISEELMESYLMTDESLDKAGAYGIQGKALTFVQSLEGSYSNVVGLPLNELINSFKTVFGTPHWRNLFCEKN